MSLQRSGYTKCWACVFSLSWISCFGGSLLPCNEAVLGRHPRGKKLREASDQQPARNQYPYCNPREEENPPKHHMSGLGSVFSPSQMFKLDPDLPDSWLVCNLMRGPELQAPSSTIPILLDHRN